MKKEVITTFDGNLIVTEMKVKHPKNGEMTDYISFSNGQDVCGVFLGKETKKELSKFLNKKGAKDGSSDNNK